MDAIRFTGESEWLTRLWPGGTQSVRWRIGLTEPIVHVACYHISFLLRSTCSSNRTKLADLCAIRPLSECLEEIHHPTFQRRSGWFESTIQSARSGAGYGKTRYMNLSRWRLQTIGLEKSPSNSWGNAVFEQVKFRIRATKTFAGPRPVTVGSLRFVVRYKRRREHDSR